MIELDDLRDLNLSDSMILHLYTYPTNVIKHLSLALECTGVYWS